VRLDVSVVSGRPVANSRELRRMVLDGASLIHAVSASWTALPALVPLAVHAASCDGHVVVFAGRQNLAHMAFGPVLDRRYRRDQ
jgi:hypothetical protein